MMSFCTSDSWPPKAMRRPISRSKSGKQEKEDLNLEAGKPESDQTPSSLPNSDLILLRPRTHRLPAAVKPPGGPAPVVFLIYFFWLF